jgi:hypothetical protein
MAVRVYRFQQVGLDIKTSLADVALAPVAVVYEGSTWVDVSIEESEAPKLQLSMLDKGFLFIETDPRVPLNFLVPSLEGCPRTVNLADNDTYVYQLDGNLAIAAGALRTVLVEYSLYLPVANRKQVGKLFITHDTTNAYIDRSFNEFEGAEVEGITFDVDIAANALRLLVTTLAVGEEPIELIFKVYPNYGL